MMFPIMCCLLRDELEKRALAGDPTAQQVVLALLPKTMPAALRRAARDEVLLAVAIKLVGFNPARSRHSTARILLAAGRRLQTRDRLDGSVVGLASHEAEVEGLVRHGLAYGAGWPALRRLEEIITPAFASNRT